MRGLVRQAATGAAPRRRSLTAGRALVALYVGSAVRCVYVARIQHSSQATMLTMVVLAAACLGVGLTLAYAKPRTDGAAAWLLVAGLIAVTTALVGVAPSRADAILRAIGYPWSALYAGFFMSRRAARSLALLTIGAFGLAIGLADIPEMVAAWVLITVTVLAVTAATTSLVEALRRQSEADPLTGLANRAGFTRLGTHALAVAAREQRPVALVLCDIDGLKLVNDIDGHAAGDELLRSVTAAWLTALRRSDVFARLGGDEFVVLLATGLRDAEEVVRRMRQATPYAFSAGTAISRPGESLDELLARADAAMYADKAARRAGQSLPSQRQPALDVAVARRPSSPYQA